MTGSAKKWERLPLDINPMNQPIDYTTAKENKQDRDLQLLFGAAEGFTLSRDLAQQLLDQPHILVQDKVIITDKITKKISRVPQATVLKVLDLSLTYPECEVFPALWGKIKKSYLEKLNSGKFITYLANLFPEDTVQFFTSQVGPEEEYPIVTMYQELHQHVNNLLENPSDMTVLFNYWKNNILALDIEDLSEKGLEKIMPFKNKKMREQGHLYVSQISYLRETVADKLVEFFYRYPEKQLELTQGFPGYYQTIEWADKEKHNIYMQHFSQKHIDSIGQYKDCEGYDRYIATTFSEEIVHNLTLTKMLSNPVIWDDVFGDTSGIIATNLADHYTKLKNGINDHAIDEALTLYHYNKVQLSLPHNEVTTKPRIKI